MGGTTAKMCLVENGAPDRKFDFEAGRVRRFVKGSGLPLKVSVVDMIEIGAGGGSIARVEEGSGLMKVGPRSAGAKPGPICYGRGGTEPTVTDSDLVLGRLDPGYFLGGEMQLNVQAVQDAIESKLAAKLNVPRDTAALGIRRIVDETMAAATRMHLAEKGRDPRRYTLIAFGGAGPVHAYDLARLLKMRRMVVPLGAGVASALGFLVAPPATDLVRNALRMRPERVIIGECRGPETLDMLQAMNTGHEGSMTTLHANSPRDALARIETMIMMTGVELPLKAMRQQIASAVDLIIQANRLQGGPRKITHITEVVGLEQETVVMQDIYRYVQTGVDETGRAIGRFEATGIRPSFMPRLEAAGVRLPASAFRQRVMLED